MKPFNLEEAKAGKPVATRDGRKARLVCFDRACNSAGKIMGLVLDGYGVERVIDYFDDGRCTWTNKTELDLFMASVKVVKWGILRACLSIGGYSMEGFYETEDIAMGKLQAMLSAGKREDLPQGASLRIVKVEWEE